MTPPQADTSGGESSIRSLSPDFRTYSAEKPAFYAQQPPASSHTKQIRLYIIVRKCARENRKIQKIFTNLKRNGNAFLVVFGIFPTKNLKNNKKKAKRRSYEESI